MAMVTTPQEPEEPTEPEAGLDERQEIRLALVMNGGVSLAIWMGGVTVEINRLVNADPVYADVLGLMRSKVRVDVIAGASAGGINGAMLAAMISHENSRTIELTSLRKIWLEDGALLQLFRSPLQKNPPSMLRGDEFFLPELRSVFEALTNGPENDPDEFPVQLTLTTTLLLAANRGFADDFGSLIADADHRGEFKFRRGEGLKDDFNKRDDLDLAKRLALASRCTASFPGAFEPSYVPVDVTPEELSSDPDRPDMKRYVNFSSSRFCVDGGVLVNKPFRPAIRGVFAQPAGDEHIRRVMAYVVPDPQDVQPDKRQERSEAQTIGGVVMASVVTLPRAESVSRELEEIAEHNRKVQAQRALREHLLAPELGDAVDIEALAIRLFVPFRDIRSQRIVDMLSTYANPFEGKFDGLGEAPWDTGELRRLIVENPEPWLPTGFPSGGSVAETPWTWGNDTIEVMGGIALNLVGMGLRAADQASEARGRIAAARAKLHALLRELRLSALALEPEFWRQQSDRAQEFWKAKSDRRSGEGTSAGWDRESFESWRGREHREPHRAPADIAVDIAAALTDVAPTLNDVAAGAPETISSKLRKMVRGFVPEVRGGGSDATLRRLLAQAIVQSVTSAGKPELDQIVELLQISSTAPNGFDARTRGSQKVAGRQLGHFGAFYKRSWRANDWMWGRMDGAARLAQMIVDPARLAQLRMSSDQAFYGLRAIALGPPDGGAHAVLADGSALGWNDQAARRELSFLDRDETPPKSLPVCARAVARRIQLRILQEELPGVADAIEFDIGEGAMEDSPATGFMRDVRSAQFAQRQDGVWIGPHDAASLLTWCNVGSENIKNEAGSDLFTSTVSTAAAVGVTALSGSAAGLPRVGRVAISSLRTPVLGFWVMARNAVSRHKTGFAMLMFLLAAGGALLAISALGNVALPGVVAAAGTLILLAGVIMAVMQLRTGGLVVILLAVAVVAAFLAVPSIVVHSYIHTKSGPLSWIARVAPPAAAVLGLVLGAMILGLAHARTPKSQRTLPGRRAGGPQAG